MFGFTYSELVAVKVTPKMRDGDNDGKCQEENGKWVPCPPGVGGGNVVDSAGNAVRKIGETIGEMADERQQLKDLAKQYIAFDADKIDFTKFTQDQIDELFDRRTPLNNGERIATFLGILSPEKETRELYSTTKYRDEFLEARQIYDDLLDDIKTNYQREFARRQKEARKAQLANLVNENGQIEPDALKAILDENRAKAAEKAEAILKDAEENITPKQRQAAKNADIRGYFNAVEEQEDEYEVWRSNWENENPEPSESDYETEEEFDNAFDEWDRKYTKDITDRRAENEQIQDDIEQHLVDMFAHDIIGRDGQTYTTKVDYINMRGREGLVVNGTMYNEYGDPIGRFTRTIQQDFDGELEVHHDYLRIEDRYQKEGIASAFNARNEQLYRDMGIDYITTHGVSDTTGFKGATHWPKNGFDWDTDYDRSRMIETIREALAEPDNTNLFDSDVQKEIIAQLLDKASRQYLAQKDRITAADLLQWPGAERWFQDSNVSINYRRNL
jgi:hypothetical protein